MEYAIKVLEKEVCRLTVLNEDYIEQISQFENEIEAAKNRIEKNNEKIKTIQELLEKVN